MFAQAKATIAAAGVAPAADVAPAVDTLRERLPEFPAAELAGAPQPAYGGRTILIVAPDAESYTIGVFGPLLSTGELGGVLNVLAFEALDRRLARGLRREFGDAYDISARPANYARDVRLLAIEGEVAAADPEEVLEVARKTTSGSAPAGRPRGKPRRGRATPPGCSRVCRTCPRRWRRSSLNWCRTGSSPQSQTTCQGGSAGSSRAR